MTKSKSAYDRVMEQKLALKQAEQRAMTPQKVGQQLLREWLGTYGGFGGVIDPFAGADLVRRVEAVVKAERSSLNGETMQLAETNCTKERKDEIG